MKSNLLTAMLLVPSIALAQSYVRDYPDAPVTTTRGFQAEAKVVEVGRIYENVVVGRNCQPVYAESAQAAQYQQPQRQQQTSGGGAIVGGLVGAVVGSRFGKGHGRDAATVAGAIGGAMVGDQIERQDVQQLPQQQRQQQAYQGVRCTPVTQSQPTGYTYVAVYNGVQFSGRTYRTLRVGDEVTVNVVTMVNPGE